MRGGILLLILAGGCASLVGIEDWSGDEGAGPTGSVGSSTTGAAGGEGPTSSGSTASSTATGVGGGAGGAGGMACAGLLDCWWGPPSAALTEAAALCSAGSPTGDCVPAKWDYCGCAGQHPAVFVELDASGDPSAVTVVAPNSYEPLNLQVNNSACADGPEKSCVTTCATGDHLYRWTDFGAIGHADIESLQVWWMDDAPACDPAMTGGKLFDLDGF